MKGSKSRSYSGSMRSYQLRGEGLIPSRDTTIRCPTAEIERQYRADRVKLWLNGAISTDLMVDFLGNMKESVKKQ